MHCKMAGKYNYIANNQYVYVIIKNLILSFPDTDECSTGLFCDQSCSNTVGSYQCGCVEGYTLHSDGKTCLGKNGKC